MRLDIAVAEQGGVTRSRARSLIMAGRVRLDGHALTKPGTTVAPGVTLEIERPAPYVSRGGEKLEAALDAFALDVGGLRALDVGASTGGFTDCLLSRGAVSVVALDVGYGQLAWTLRADPRVTVVERTNFRTLPDDAFPEGFDIVTVDASFISLRTIVARALAYLRPDAPIVALLKPQFEAGRERIGSGGVVRDAATHRAILSEFRADAATLGVVVREAIVSPLRGPAGNAEFLLLLRRDGETLDDGALDRLVAEVHP